MFITFFVSETSVGAQLVLILLSFPNMIFVLQDVGMQVVEGSTSRLASMITCSLQGFSRTKCPLLLLFFFHSLQVFSPDLFFSSCVKAVVRWLVAPVIHHIDKLDRKSI